MTRILRLLIPTLLVVACAEQVTDPAPQSVVELAIDVPAIALGDRTPITLRVLTDGVARVARVDEYTVASSDPAVLSVATNHVLVGSREGTATVTVTMRSDTARSATRSMTVGPAEFVGLTIAPPAAMIPGDSASVSVSGLTRGGASLSTAPGVAMISRSAALQVLGTDRVVARDTGTTWLIARAPTGATDSIRIVLAYGSASALSIAPHNATINVSDTVRIVIALTDRRGNRLGTSSVQFGSNNATVATVSGAGTVIARQGGAARIIATAGALADTLDVLVNAPAPPDSPPPPPPPPPPAPPTTPPPSPPGIISVTPPGAHVQVRLTGTPSAAVLAAFTSAAAKLNAMVRSGGGVYAVPLLVPAGSCSDPQPAINETVDGLLIMASVGPIDGAGSILGYAGPCLVRSGARGLPALGIMVFDEADMQNMANNGLLGGVVLHEMVHVLGIGTLWGPAWQGWVADPQGANPRYDGPTGRAEYTTLSPGDGANGVPVENTGGQGTRGGHWRESIFQTELMTGWAGGAMAMSRVTVGALLDMGYDLDLARADAYALPSGLGGIREHGIEIIDRMVAPIGQVDPTGRIRRFGP